VYKKNELDAKEINETENIKIPDDGMILEPNKIYLGCTSEIIGSDYYVPIITGRNSTGRLGLFVHITSDLVDIGFHGKLTLQFHATQPVKIYKGMAIGQITFWRICGKIKLYEGKYQGSGEPRASEVWRDFK
jgi:dCTP deaminase